MWRVHGHLRGDRPHVITAAPAPSGFCVEPADAPYRERDARRIVIKRELRAALGGRVGRGRARDAPEPARAGPVDHVADRRDGRRGLRFVGSAGGAVPRPEDECGGPARRGARPGARAPCFGLIVFCGLSGALSSQTHNLVYKQRTTWRQRPSSKSASRTRNQSEPGALALSFLTSAFSRTRDRRRFQAVEK